jgi:hypothetical protein
MDANDFHANHLSGTWHPYQTTRNDHAIPGNNTGMQVSRQAVCFTCIVHLTFEYLLYLTVQVGLPQHNVNWAVLGYLINPFFSSLFTSSI